jgi:DNA-directed RNA polymerase specialized sigma24 family protein
VAAAGAPPTPTAARFAWLRTTAIREAIKLYRRAAETVSLDEAAEVVRDRRNEPDRHLEVIIGGEEIRAARLPPRESLLLGWRVAGYSRDQIAELTGDSHRRAVLLRMISSGATSSWACFA